MKIFILIIFLLLINSCAGFVAATKSNEDDISSIKNGISQAEVEMILGLREKTIIINSNERIDYYRFNPKSDENYKRGVIHIFMSIGTKGLWELLAMPYERHIGKTRYLAVKYDRFNKAKDIQILDLNIRD